MRQWVPVKQKLLVIVVVSGAATCCEFSICVSDLDLALRFGDVERERVMDLTRVSVEASASTSSDCGVFAV